MYTKRVVVKNYCIYCMRHLCKKRSCKIQKKKCATVHTYEKLSCFVFVAIAATLNADSGFHLYAP